MGPRITNVITLYRSPGDPLPAFSCSERVRRVKAGSQYDDSSAFPFVSFHFVSFYRYRRCRSQYDATDDKNGLCPMILPHLAMGTNRFEEEAIIVIVLLRRRTKKMLKRKRRHWYASSLHSEGSKGSTATSCKK